MRYSMYDTRGRGDAGPMSQALVPTFEDGKMTKLDTEDNARPRLGVAMRVGTFFSRSYSAQDWWQTTLIAEIVSDEPEKVVFRTRSGSTYTWEII